MTNITADDDYLHRLGKLTPVYIIALMTALEGLLAPLRGLDIAIQAAGVAIVFASAIACFWHFEIRNQKVNLRPQLIVAFLTSMLYLTLSIMRLLAIEVGDWNYVIMLGVAAWTFIMPQLIKG